MKQEFETPEMEIVNFTIQDVIATSPGDPDDSYGVSLDE